MSIILKGIDLPKENGFHIITIWSDGVIYARTVEGLSETTINKAEAIQIPKTHGRIGDIDGILEALPTEYLGSTVHAIINEAPTILEAEEQK